MCSPSSGKDASLIAGSWPEGRWRTVESRTLSRSQNAGATSGRGSESDFYYKSLAAVEWQVAQSDRSAPFFPCFAATSGIWDQVNFWIFFQNRSRVVARAAESTWRAGPRRTTGPHHRAAHQSALFAGVLVFAEMIRPVVTLETKAAPVGWPFIFLELLAVVTVPILGYLGSQVLLDSRAGRFLSEPGPEDPGYRTLVDPSPITAVVETFDGTVSGVVVITGLGADEFGGGIVVVPAELTVDGSSLAERTPEEAVDAVESAWGLRIPTSIVVDGEAWDDTLGPKTYGIDNPDPLATPNASSGRAFDVGPVDLDAESIDDYLAASTRTSETGEITEDDPRFHLHRRRLVWEQLAADPPRSETELAALLARIGGGSFRVELLPVTGRPLVAESDSVEALVRELVAFPAGAGPGDRLRVRVLGDPRSVNVYEAAAVVAGYGVEVVELGNVGDTSESDTASDGESSSGTARSVLVVPSSLDDPRVAELADALDADTLTTDEADDDVDGIITLLVGAELIGS